MAAGTFPQGIRVDPATSRVYVANIFANTLTVIDGQTMAVATTVPTEEGPDGVALDPRARRVYVAANRGHRLQVFDATSGGHIATVSSGLSYPSGTDVNPVTGRVYVANIGILGRPSTVAVFDGATNGLLGTVPVGVEPRNVAVNSQTNRAYAPNFGSSNVSVIDGATDTVVATVPVGEQPYDAAVNAVTNRVYVSNRAGNAVTVIDGATNTPIALVPVGVHPEGVAVNPLKNRVYVANSTSQTLSVIDGVTNSVVATVLVGVGPNRVAVDSATGLVYVADADSHTVTVVRDTATATQVTPTPTATPGPAVVYTIQTVPTGDAQPSGLALGSDGSLYFTDGYHRNVRRIAPDGSITTVASMEGPTDITYGSDGSVYVTDGVRQVVERVRPDGTVTRVAGNGVRAHSGDGGPATAASLADPRGLAIAADGTLYIAEYFSSRIRKVAPDGTISTVAGGGTNRPGDGGQATAANLFSPDDVVVTSDGTLYFTELNGYRVRKVAPSGVISTVAGTGIYGYFGDGGPATIARIGSPHGLAVTDDGRLFFADSSNHRLRMIGPDGTISTIAGDGRGFVPGASSGDGGPATAAQLVDPEDVVVAPDGTIFVSERGDTFRTRIRKLIPHTVPPGVTPTPAPTFTPIPTPTTGPGQPWTWGSGGNSQLGDGYTGTRLEPVQVRAISGVVGVSAGDSHTVAVKEDGTVWTWGSNDGGQLGAGSSAVAGRAAPGEVVGLSRVTAVSSRFGHNLALKTDATVWAWGGNRTGQLGDGTFVRRDAPVQVAGLHDVIAAAAGHDHSLALKGDGTVWAWGSNENGQLGQGTWSLDAGQPTPVQVSGLGDVVAIAAGGYHSLALKRDGTVWGWGQSGNGQLGPAPPVQCPGQQCQPLPVQIPGLSDVRAIAAGGRHSLALAPNGTVWAWGASQLGQFGGPPFPQRAIPTQVPSLSDVRFLVGSFGNSFAIKLDGTVWGWGDNSLGQLGDGTATTRYSPVPVLHLSGITSLAASRSHTVAVQAPNRGAATPTATWSPTAPSTPTPTSAPSSTATPTTPTMVATVTATPAPSGGGSSGGSGGGGGGGGGGSSAPAAGPSQPAAAPPPAQAGQTVRLLEDGRVAVAVPGRADPVVVEAGEVPYTPNEWCARERVYRGHVRLEDVGLAGATFGVTAEGALDWIPPQDAGCVDWAKVDASVNLPKEVIMQFALLRPLPGALLWVLDGDASWRGRLYEVGADGRARYVSAPYWAAHEARFREVWPNVMPVSQRQVEDFAARGLVGPDL